MKIEEKHLDTESIYVIGKTVYTLTPTFGKLDLSTLVEKIVVEKILDKSQAETPNLKGINYP